MMLKRFISVVGFAFLVAACTGATLPGPRLPVVTDSAGTLLGPLSSGVFSNNAALLHSAIKSALHGASNSVPDVIDVRKYGANPTNTAEANKTAIDAAIIALTNSQNAILYFGPGTYQSTGPHVLPESGVAPNRVGANPSISIRGSGNTVVQCTGTNIGAFFRGGANWESITIAGPGMQHSVTGLVQLLPGNNVMRNVEWRDWGGYGVLVDDCTYQVYSDVRFLRCNVGYGSGYKNDGVHFVGRADNCNWGIEIGALGPGTISHLPGTTGASASGYYKVMGNHNTNAIVVIGGTGSRGLTVEVYSENLNAGSTNGYVHIGHDPAMWHAAAVENNAITATIRNSYFLQKRGESAIKIFRPANLIVENSFSDHAGPMIQNFYATDDDPIVSVRNCFTTDGLLFQSYGGYKVSRSTFEWSRHAGLRVFSTSGFSTRQMFEGMALQSDKPGPFRFGWYNSGGTKDFTDFRAGITSTNIGGGGTNYQLLAQNMSFVQPEKPPTWTWLVYSNYFGADQNVFPRLTLGGIERTNWPSDISESTVTNIAIAVAQTAQQEALDYTDEQIADVMAAIPSVSGLVTNYSSGPSVTVKARDGTDTTPVGEITLMAGFDPLSQTFGGITIAATNAATLERGEIHLIGNVSVNGGLYGDGSGLTNLPVSVPAGIVTNNNASAVTLNNSLTVQSNLTAQSMNSGTANVGTFYLTNAIAANVLADTNSATVGMVPKYKSDGMMEWGSVDAGMTYDLDRAVSMTAEDWTPVLTNSIPTNTVRRIYGQLVAAGPTNNLVYPFDLSVTRGSGAVTFTTNGVSLAGYLTNGQTGSIALGGVVMQDGEVAASGGEFGTLAVGTNLLSDAGSTLNGVTLKDGRIIIDGSSIAKAVNRRFVADGDSLTWQGWPDLLTNYPFFSVAAITNYALSGRVSINCLSNVHARLGPWGKTNRTDDCWYSLYIGNNDLDLGTNVVDLINNYSNCMVVATNYGYRPIMWTIQNRGAGYLVNERAAFNGWVRSNYQAFDAVVFEPDKVFPQSPNTEWYHDGEHWTTNALVEISRQIANIVSQFGFRVADGVATNSVVLSAPKAVVFQANEKTNLTLLPDGGVKVAGDLILVGGTLYAPVTVTNLSRAVVVEAVPEMMTNNINVPVSFRNRFDVSFGGLSLVWGADESATTRTDSTDKRVRVGLPHFLNAEEPVAGIVQDSTSTANNLNFGGGSSSLNAATAIKFWTAASRTTTTGTVRMGIDGDGRVSVWQTLAATNGFIVPQLASIPTNSIPTGSTTATNWSLVNIGGIPTLVATNHASGGWLTKPLWP